jgi:hypothetical protein
MFGGMGQFVQVDTESRKRRTPCIDRLTSLESGRANSFAEMSTCVWEVGDSLIPFAGFSSEAYGVG